MKNLESNFIQSGIENVVAVAVKATVLLWPKNVATVQAETVPTKHIKVG